MGVILGLLIVMGILALLVKWLNNCNDKALEPINARNIMYKNKVCEYCRNNNLPEPNDIIFNSEEIRVKYGKRYVHAPGFLWNDDKYIVFCPDWLNLGVGEEMDIANNILVIPIESIRYYTKDGNITYTNQIVNSGKNISISGAIVGGVIAGEVGAIIGARKDANKVENVTTQHDDVHTYIYYVTDNENVNVAEVKGAKFYSKILHLIPDKEYSYLIANNNL